MKTVITIQSQATQAKKMIIVQRMSRNGYSVARNHRASLVAVVDRPASYMRSCPMIDRVAGEPDRHFQRSDFQADNDLAPI
jgi:hypothetical protein